MEDQHNNPTLGALRGGVADFTGATMAVGRGNVQGYVDLNDKDEFGDNDGESRKSGADARTAAAGANYFGRSTGLADKLIDKITEDDLRTGRMDCVRAQQKENWFNQRAIHEQNRAQGQGVVFGDTSMEGRPTSGGYIAREAIASQAWRTGARESEISQGDLANHLSELASQEAPRLDGQEWGELHEGNSADGVRAELLETFSVRASPRQTHVTEIDIQNDVNTFAPYRCGFVGGSSSAFTCDPTHGTMNRRSGEPIHCVVRYTPQETGSIQEGTFVFETEDMKKVYKFVGST